MSAIELLAAAVERSFAVGVLIAAVLLIRRPFAQLFGARAAYALWLAPVIRLFLPELKILTAPPAPIPGDPVVAFVEAAPVSIAALPDANHFWEIAAAAMLFVWIAVAVGWVTSRLNAQHRLMRSIYKATDAAPASLQDEAVTAARAIAYGGAIRLRIAREACGPMVAGIVRPVIVVPATFADDFTPMERKLALAHEMAHIKRGDLLLGSLALLFQSAQWTNPLAHWGARCFRIDQEAACDAFVLSHVTGKRAAASYASAILKSINGPAPANALSMGHPLKERIMLLNKSNNPSTAKRLTGIAGATALVIAGLGATASYGFAQDTDGPAPKEEIIIEQEIVEGEPTQIKKRVLVFSGTEDEVMFDDVAIGDRVRVMEFDDDKGERRVIRIENGTKTVRVFREDGELISEDVSKVGSGQDTIVIREGAEGQEMEIVTGGELHFNSLENAGCIASEGEGEPVMLEFKDESGDASDKSVYHTVICLTGDEAAPENRAEALERAIDRMEKQAKEENARRKQMIKSLREQAKKLEKED